MDRAASDPGQAGASTPYAADHIGADDHDDPAAPKHVTLPDEASGSVERSLSPPVDQGDLLDLAERLRSQGVVVVASRAVAESRPEGVDLLGALPVLTRELAQEWQDAADCLPVLHADRLQLRSAAALLLQGAASAEADAVEAEALDSAAVARAVALRAQLQPPADPPTPGEGAEHANLLLDRTWAVLCDLRRLAVDSPEPDPHDARGLGIVPSAARATAEQARRLGPALHRAACAGALVGLLAPWLPPIRTDALACVDALLEAVSDMARRPHDRIWWSTLVTLGRVAASLSVAACHAAARYSGRSSEAAALVLSEPALGRLADQARSMAAALAASGPSGVETEENPRADNQMPQASPSQQARAAAERAAAERRATQQAFMERAIATRAARSASAAMGTRDPGTSVGAPFLDGTRSGESHQDLAVTAPIALPASAPTEEPVQVVVPALAEVQADLGELEEEEISLGVWDTLMRPR